MPIRNSLPLIDFLDIVNPECETVLPTWDRDFLSVLLNSKTSWMMAILRMDVDLK